MLSIIAITPACATAPAHTAQPALVSDRGSGNASTAPHNHYHEPCGTQHPCHTRRAATAWELRLPGLPQHCRGTYIQLVDRLTHGGISHGDFEGSTQRV